MTSTVVTPFAVELPDADLVDRVLRASARIRAYCRWHVSPSITETITLDGSGQQFLMLPSLYVTDVATVTEDGTVLASDQYEWSVSGQMFRVPRWSGHFRSVEVEFTHGYSVAPEGLRDVCITVAKRLPIEESSVSQESAGGVSRVYAGLLAGQASLAEAFTAAERLALDEFRLSTRP